MPSKPVVSTLGSLLFAWLSCPAASAETCKYVDKDGHVTYSNAPVPNARRIGCIKAPPPVKGPAATEPTKPGQGTPQAGSKLPDGPHSRTSDDRRKALVEKL